MSNTPDYNFCRNCIKHKFDFKEGIKCSITGSKPDFLGECQDFKPISPDFFEKEAAKHKDPRSEEEIYLDKVNKIFGDRFEFTDYYKHQFTEEEVNELPDKTVLKYSKFEIYISLFGGVAFIAMSIYILIISLENYIYVIFGFIVGAFFTAKAISLINNRLSPVSISKQGIHVKDKFSIRWSKVKYILETSDYKHLGIQDTRKEKPERIFATSNLELNHFEILKLAELYLFASRLE